MKKNYKNLCKLLASIKNEKEADMLLRDLLSPKERDELAERWSIVCELLKGTTQRKIAEKLGVSIGTITRGSTEIKYGAGGFAKFYKRLFSK